MNFLRALVVFSFGSTSWVHGKIEWNGCDVGVDCCDKDQESCDALGDNGYFSLTSNTCLGEQACSEAGSDSGYASIDVGSCSGEQACELIAKNNGAVNVGKSSCIGDKACSGAGDDNGEATIGLESCTAREACINAGDMNTTVVIGVNSCTKHRSCANLGGKKEPKFAGTVTVKDNSCNNDRACENVGTKIRNPDDFIFIGSNSCNCKYCCKCLGANDVVPDYACNERGKDNCCLGNGRTRNPDFNFDTTPSQKEQEAGANGDPIILGLKDQVFKFTGRDGAWYSNLSSKNFQWNMQFKEFDSCPADENMFISGMSISTSDNKDKAVNSDILIVTTPEPIAECREDPNLVCLGEGTLHISFDGGKTFVSQPGDYHYSSLSRVVAHNTYAACSRKWHDYEVSASETSVLRDGGRRAKVHEKKPLQLLSDKKLTMIDPSECNVWIEDRDNKNDLFQQRGHWSTMYIETPLVSFHIEYRRSDWFDPKCDFQSLDAWMTKVSDKMEKTEWHGILGETKTKIYDLMTGKQIKTDRSKLLRGKEDSDYEVAGPFDTKFAALGKHNGFNKVVSSIIESVSK